MSVSPPIALRRSQARRERSMLCTRPPHSAKFNSRWDNPRWSRGRPKSRNTVVPETNSSPAVGHEKSN